MDAKHTIHIGNIVRNAAVFNFRNWSGGTEMNTDALRQAVVRLFTLLHERQIEYVLVGGIALRHYVDSRNTEDIDLVMASSDLERMPEIEIADREEYFARGKYNELRVDVLLTRNPLFSKLQSRYATTQPFMERNIVCATVEGLLLLKLYALPSLYRQGNFTRVALYENDIATLMYAYQPELAPLFDELSHHLSDADLTSVREITTEIQQRIDRFRQTSGDGE